MPRLTMPIEPKTIPSKTKIDPELKQKTQVEEQGQVILHCTMLNDFQETLIRIWPSTYLIDDGGQKQASLVHPEGIPMAPTWLRVKGSKVYFTLIFTGLDKSVQRFRMVEFCNGQSGAMSSAWLLRNDTDVYHVEVT